MTPAEILAASKRQRATWFELDEPARRAVLLRRPLDSEMLAYRRQLAAMDLVGLVEESAIDWRGFTEADILGAGVGASDAAPFSRELFAEWAGDHTEDVTLMATDVLERVARHATETQAARKNSSTS